MSETIEIRKAKEHNLKGFDITLPRDSLVVITGVSGSGKSSLAFDTIFQEGQRRYVESLSAYARQFIGSMKRPDVESVRGISPTISIDQKTVNRNPRSTVGTVVELMDHYRLLFARLGVPHCPQCNKRIQAQTPEQVVDGLFTAHPGVEVSILAPIVQERKGEYRKELADLKAAGFQRVRIDGTVLRIEEAPELARYEKHTIEAVVDRTRIEERNLSRVREAVEQALRLTEDVVAFLFDDGKREIQGTKLGCPTCRISLPEVEPRLFSFNDAQGQCPRCKGLGKAYTFEEHLLVPDPSLSIEGGAIKARTANGNLMFSKWGDGELKAMAKAYAFSLSTPWQQLSRKQRDIVLHGTPEALRYKAIEDGWHGPRKVDKDQPVPGVIPILTELWDRWHISFLHKYMREEICPECNGARLCPAARAVRFRGKPIHELARWSVEDSQQFFADLKPEAREERVGREIFKEIRGRLGFLQQVGLGYLTLDRSAATLSGGEAQRIRLAGQVGAGLQGVLYVLDEPSIGLHPRDNEALLATLLRLRDAGNSLVVVEHDEETMLRADWLVDIGPAAGEHGGEVVAAGTPAQVMATKASITGDYLAGRRRLPIPEVRRPADNRWLTIKGAKCHNLKGVDVSIPAGLFTAVTGVSGSGKSSLVHGILVPALAAEYHGAEGEPGPHKSITGKEHFDKVVEIDQSPIGRTPRSNPATYTKVFDLIRDLFAALPESKTRGYGKSRFSFNVKGGRCEACEGAGVREVEMQILPNVEVPCETCDGKRFNNATLEIHYKGRTVSDVLDMSVEEALQFFQDHPDIRRILQVLFDVGLGYIRLGQTSTTLSGGEAQRMKIATELRRRGTGRTLYVLDEPTTGLHFQDVDVLLRCLQELVQQGNTLLVIEHNLDMIAAADWVIDLGPEGGKGGGLLMGVGTPEQVAKIPGSETGRFLAKHLEQARRKQSSLVAATKTFTPQKLSAASTTAVYSTGPDIQVQGARKHNLRNFDVTIPRHRLTVVTGVSGSGKSSLAFHTLFAEGQRRFVESLSTYARRFLGKVDRGMVDAIHGLAPAIAIDQGTAGRSPRSTVATMTELHDYFRILYARAGHCHCPQCGAEAVSHEVADLLAPAFTRLPAASKSQAKAGVLTAVLAPLFLPKWNRSFQIPSPSDLPNHLGRLTELGVQRLLVDGKVFPIADAAKKTGKAIWAILDRIDAGKPANRQRFAEALERSYEMGNGILGLTAMDGEAVQEVRVHSRLPACGACGWVLERPLDPKNFSFNSHWGACDDCQGLGSWNGGVCPACKGTRLKPQFASVLVGDQGIATLGHLSIVQARDWFRTLKLGTRDTTVAAPLVKEISGRLDFLVSVGLDYLQLDRTGDTLSGGEAQRIRLASQIGSGLEGVLYVLDEPTVGLHQSDTDRLIDTLHRLRDLGNTLVVVEHDMQMVQAADHILDIGPHAGDGGGEVVAQGSPADLRTGNFPQSLTADYLSGRRDLGRDHTAREVSSCGWIRMQNLRHNNLKGISVAIPLGRLSAISGVSGSGKSSLIMDCLMPLATKVIEGKKGKTKALEQFQIEGEELHEVVLVDQTPIGGTPRSTPASYLGILDPLRKLFATLPEAKAHGFDNGRFSYNKKGGRCEACEGRGFTLVEMHFLSDVWELCESCKGKRFNSETLQVKFRGKHIADILDMRASEAMEFFDNQPAIRKPLQILHEIGLGYIRLGQSANTLSGGEAQRMKLAAELARGTRKHILYLLDEPSTGLHLHDIKALLGLLQRLVSQGHTVVLVEHHPDLIRLSDWVVDLGPGGGDTGGNVLFQGAVKDFLKLRGKNATRDALRAATSSWLPAAR